MSWLRAGKEPWKIGGRVNRMHLRLSSIDRSFHCRGPPAVVCRSLIGVAGGFGW